MQTNKKRLLIFVIAVIVVAAGAAGYIFIYKEAAEPIIWDGSYRMTGMLICEGNIPNLTSIPMDTTVIVSNNKIVEEVQQTVKSFDIDKHGKATEIIESATNEGVTTSGKADYQFYNEGGVHKFTGSGAVDMSIVQDGETYSSTCSGTVTGVKQ